MLTTPLLPEARPRWSIANKAFGLLLASCFTARLATAQATTPAAAAANADMLSWMAHGLLAAVAGLTVLTCLVLLIAFTGRRANARPLAPAAAEPLAATPAGRVAA